MRSCSLHALLTHSLSVFFAHRCRCRLGSGSPCSFAHPLPPICLFPTMYLCENACIIIAQCITNTACSARSRSANAIFGSDDSTQAYVAIEIAHECAYASHSTHTRMHCTCRDTLSSFLYMHMHVCVCLCCSCGRATHTPEHMIKIFSIIIFSYVNTSTFSRLR